LSMLTFARRNLKELLRDPTTVLFALGFPLGVLGLLSAIQQSIPVPLFTIERLSPGIAVFGLSFMTLFSATLVSRDRETALLRRLYTTPMTALDFILGYMLPLLPLALLQGVACMLAAMALGLSPSVNVLYTVLALVPMAAFHIALGLLCGSVFSVKLVGGLCGALLSNLSAWLSGAWFDIALVGGAFLTIAQALPFLYAVESARAMLQGQYSTGLAALWPVAAWAAAALAAAVAAFIAQMRRQ